MLYLCLVIKNKTNIMKTISKKQFETAVKKVLAGGTSKIITTSEVYPFYWARIKGHHKLQVSIHQNSKFVKNTGRGGKASDLYLICELSKDYVIMETKAEIAKREKLERQAKDVKKTVDKQKRLEKKLQFENTAKSYGLTPQQYSEKLTELQKINNEIYAEYLVKIDELLANFEGKDSMFKIQNRVKFQQIVEKSEIKYTPKKISEIC